MDALSFYKVFWALGFGGVYPELSTDAEIFIETPVVHGVLRCGIHENRNILPRSEEQVRSLLLGEKALETAWNFAFGGRSRKLEVDFNAALGATYETQFSAETIEWTVIEAGIVGEGNAVERLYWRKDLPTGFFRVDRTNQ